MACKTIPRTVLGRRVITGIVTCNVVDDLDIRALKGLKRVGDVEFIISMQKPIAWETVPFTKEMAEDGYHVLQVLQRKHRIPRETVLLAFLKPGVEHPFVIDVDEPPGRAPVFSTFTGNHEAARK